MKAALLLAMTLLAAGRGRAQTAPAGALDPVTARPETVGFSSERLARVDALMQGLVDQKRLAGIVTLLARHGKVVDFKAFGQRDIASGAPMEKDAIFRLYSMSKPVIGVAMMILYEEGRWNPQDPLSKYIPEFAHLKVFKGLDANGAMLLEAPAGGPTMRQLMTHTAGFTYGLRPAIHWTPVDELYVQKGILTSGSLQDMIGKLARTPLLYQPGTEWVYSVSVDIQGYLIQKLSGMSLPDFLRRRIFEPLGMKDTGFYVPPEKRGRFATLYNSGKNGELVVDNGKFAGVAYDHPPGMPSGGAGLVSTAEDYRRFAQMLLNGGELGGVRILGPETINLMRSNHLAPELLTGRFAPIRNGYSYGYDVAVYTDPALVDSPVGRGTYLWGGASDTTFWVDPANDIVFVGLTQHLGGAEKPNLGEIARAVIYPALVEPGR